MGEKEAAREMIEALVVGNVNLTIMLRYVSINIARSVNKQPITTHVLVSNSQLEYAIRFLQSGGRYRS